MRIILLSIISFFLLFSGSALAKDPWPGLSPDCWKEPRNIHNLRNTDYWKTRIKFEHVPAKSFKEKVFSRNQGYYYAKESWQDNATVYIYSEKDYLIQINLKDVRGINVKWINEKLLFLQPWWGRIAGTDIIYDVENEKIIYKEDIESGHIAFQQYQQGCAEHGGCECIKKPKK